MLAEKVKHSKSLDSFPSVNCRGALKQTFKGIVDKTMKSKKVIRRITFAVEESKNVVKKEKKKLVSPPPQNCSDGEEDEELTDDDAIKTFVSMEPKLTKDDLANEYAIRKEQCMSVPKLLVHSASFYAGKKGKSDNIICPPSPRKVREDGRWEILEKMRSSEPESIVSG